MEKQKILLDFSKKVILPIPSVHPGEGRGPDHAPRRPGWGVGVLREPLVTSIWTPAFAGVHGEREGVRGAREALDHMTNL